MADVYKMLREDIIENNPWITETQAFSLVNFLDSQGIIDYDNLKEIYLYEEEE